VAPQELTDTPINHDQKP